MRIFGVQTPLHDTLDLLASEVARLRGVRRTVGIGYGIVGQRVRPVLDFRTISGRCECSIASNIRRTSINSAVVCRRGGYRRALIELVLGRLQPKLGILGVLGQLADGNILSDSLLVNPRVSFRMEVDSKLNLVGCTDRRSQDVGQTKVLETLVEHIDCFRDHLPLDIVSSISKIKQGGCLLFALIHGCSVLGSECCHS